MRKPRLLDTYCKAGGATRGYQLAGFHVTGIDIDDQPRYVGDDFIHGDAIAYLSDPDFLAQFHVLAGSPPCRDHSTLSSISGQDGSGWLLDATRERFIASGKPYVIENVPGAHMPGAITLCGTEFGLSTDTDRKGLVWLKRHRQFESNVLLMGAGGCYCSAKRGRTIGVYGHGDGGGRGSQRGWKGSFADRKAVMGIDWMDRNEIAQAIPPAMTRFIGEQLLAQIGARA